MRRPEGISKRVREVVTVFMRSGLQVPLARMKVSGCASIKCRLHCTWNRWRGKTSSEIAWPDAVRESFIKLGPAFVKAGQILSVRSDLIPAELADALKSLQSNVPAVSYDKISASIETELEKPIKDLFKSFETTPLAAGSIAQVYRGVWFDGTEVVVKIKRPDIDKKIKDDLEILVWLAESLEKYLPKTRKYHPSIAAKELLRYTEKELDFNNEAQVAELIGNVFESSDDILVPKIIRHTKNVIVMEYIDSFPLDDIEKIKALKIDVENLVKAGLSAMLKQIFDVGYFHGDPHPGNLHVTSDGRIVFLDFGIFGHLDDKMRRYGALVLLEVTKGNMALMSHFLLQMADIEEGANTKEFVRKVSEAYHTWRMSTIGEYGFGKLVFQMFTLGARHGVRFPPDLVLYSKAMLTIEGVALTLAPGLNLANESAPYFENLKNQLFSFDRLKDQAVDSLPIWFDLLERLPVALAFGFDHMLTQTGTTTTSPKESRNQSLNLSAVSAVLSVGLLISGAILATAEGAGQGIVFYTGYSLIGFGFFIALMTIFMIKKSDNEYV